MTSERDGAGVLDGPFDLLGRRQPDGDPLALLAARRLDDDAAVLVQETAARLGVAIRQLRRHANAGGLDDAPGDALVVADRHGDGRGELGERLAAAHGAPAIGEAEETSLGVDHLDGDAAPARLVDDDPGIRVQARIGRRAREEALVDRVLALDGEDGNAAEAELLVERDRALVVVQDRQVHPGGAAPLEVLGQPADQRLADAAVRRLRSDGEAPERRAALRVVEGAAMIDAHHRAQDLAGLDVLGDQHRHRAGVPVRPEEVGRHRHHLPRGVDDVDRLGILSGREAPDREGLVAPAGRAVGGELEPEGVRRVEEQFLRRRGQHDMRVAHVHGDVAPVRRFGAQRFGDALGRPEGVREDQPAPAAVDAGVLFGDSVRRVAGLEPLLVQAAEAVRMRVRAARPLRLAVCHQIPCSWSHSSSNATCHSSDPRSLVMCSAGAAKRRSR